MASASGKPDGLVVVRPGTEREFIAPMGVEKLPGIGHHTAEVLQRMNVTTIGQLAELPEWSLESMFGARGIALHERAQGRDSRVIAGREIPKSISRETSFHENTTDLREIEGMLCYLTERAAKTLRELGLMAKAVTVKIRYSDFEGDAVTKSLPERTNLDEDLFKLAHAMLRGLYRRRVSLHHVGVVLSNIRAEGGVQAGLFDRRKRLRLRELYQVIDEVRDRFGHGAIVAGRSLDLLNRLPKCDHGFVLRTPSLTK
jgi:DNA polymerase-4